jgi:hypothetical protein
MELDELHVDDGGAGTYGKSDAVATHRRRVCAGPVGISDAARREHNSACLDHLLPVVAVHERAGHLAIAGLQQPDDATRCDSDSGPFGCHAERPMNFGARGITARMHDPCPAVPTFERPRQTSVAPPVEHRPQSDQVGDPLWSLLDQEADMSFVAEARAGNQRVPLVIVRVVGAERRRDTALRPRRTALARTEHQHITGGRQTEVSTSTERLIG